MQTTDQLNTALEGRYRVGRELGAGGMATVYLAHDIRHERDVAIKVLHPDLGAALGSERFLSEIRTTARLQHPHILPLLDSGSANGLLFYVMPLVTGETLRARLHREMQLPVDDAVRIAREIADALGYAHSLGVIHRDIKPENILLQNGHATVADFGIALAVQSAGGTRLTQTGLSLGTPQYMSPEQATGERIIDARSDIYALGAVLYEMLVGEPPFTGPSVQAIVARVMTEDPRGLTVQRKAIPPAVDAAVLRALEKLPADRFASANEFAAALDARTIETRATRAHPAKAPGRSALFATAGVAAIMAVFAAWGWLRPRPAPSVVRYGIVLDSVTALRNFMGDLAISPDGSVLVYAGGRNGALMVRRRNELGFSALPGTESGNAPFFTSDGSQIGFFADGKVMLVALAGGPPAVVLDSLVVPDGYMMTADGYLYGAQRENGLFGIARVKPGTSSSKWEMVTTVDTATGEHSQYLPDVLPNGKVLFQVSFRDGRRAIAVGDAKTHHHTVLMPGVRAKWTGDGHLLYTTIDGKLWSVGFDQNSLKTTGAPTLVAEGIPTTILGPVNFAISASGTLVYWVDGVSARRELALVSRDGKSTPVDTTWRGTFSTPAISPDGSRLAVAVRDASSADVWVKRLSGGSAVKLTFESKSNEEPAWTPDGRSITYLSGTTVASSVGDVVRQAADGSERSTTLLHLDRAISEHTWSLNGDWLVVRTTTSAVGAGDILALRAGQKGSAVPVIATPNSEYTPTLSPDGKWLAYVSNETGRYEVFVVPFPDAGAGKRQISTRGGIAPRWSRRGGEIFYLDLQSTMMSAQVTTSPTFSVLGTRPLFSAADYVLNGYSRRNYDVAADDQHFLMVRRAAGSAPPHLVVVENWFEEARAPSRTARP